MSVSSFYAKKAIAKESFKLSKDLKFVEVYNVVEKLNIVEDSDELDIWVALALPYEGNAPESYRVLNSVITDWVEENTESICKTVEKPILDYFSVKYPGLDVSAIQDGGAKDLLWEDQVDFLVQIDEKQNQIVFELELVLDLEEIDE